MNRRGLLILVLLGLALVTSTLVWKLRPQPKPVPPEEARSDYTLDNFELVTLDEQGKESFSVRAPRLERDPQGKSLTITAPNFSFPGKGAEGGRWTATAGTAWVGPKGEQVRLLRDVHMVGPPGARGEQTRMRTARLEILPKQDKASSPSVVTITRGDSILQGTGLQADLDTHRVQFLADVKGRYAPRRR
jgi:lipopolysaccharide export system protein LptC